ncbi:methyltransferase domain-containing protein [Streptomyces sp. SBT349]|uniref:class I SAM-dependent methyltransferase n=1 Tax=Streptomyces sp. SBT349 TaxID=1580539 RepID=UPI00066D76BC
MTSSAGWPGLGSSTRLRPLGFAGDASFDGVLCALVIHHVRDRPWLLREFLRVLAPRRMAGALHDASDGRRRRPDSSWNGSSSHGRSRG